MESATQVKPEEKIAQAQPAQSSTQPDVANVASIADEAKPNIKSPENEPNWKIFREKREQERKERDAAQRLAAEERARADALKLALEAAINKPAQRQAQNEYEQDESEEDRLQKKIDAAVELRIEKERRKFNEEQQQREQEVLPQKLREAYPDFANVCSSENTDYLEYHYPEVTKAFGYMPEGFEKWSAVYKAIKRFIPNSDSRKDEAKAQKNMQKPGSLSAPGGAQGSATLGASRLDEQRKADNWARMQKTLKGLS